MATLSLGELRREREVIDALEAQTLKITVGPVANVSILDEETVRNFLSAMSGEKEKENEYHF